MAKTNQSWEKDEISKDPYHEFTQENLPKPYNIPTKALRRKALLVGINYFGQKSELRGCINDVKNMYSFLTQNFHYTKQDFQILTDDNADPRYHPTKTNLLAAFHWLSSDAKPGDYLIFHYSGHGGQMKDKDSDELDGYDETIIPSDYNTQGVIIDDEIHHILIKPLPEGVRFTCIMDCCHSGTVLDLPYVYKAKDPSDVHVKSYGIHRYSGSLLLDVGLNIGVNVGLNLGTNLYKAGMKAYRKKKFKPQTDKISQAFCVQFSGCADQQTSADASFQGQAQGAMSHSLICALKELGFQPSYDELLVSMRKILNKQDHFQQIPQLCYGRMPFDPNQKFDM